MAKVEMSLNEYDEMKGRIEFLERVIKEMTTPVPSDWELNYAKSSGSISINTTITPEVQEFIRGEIEKNAPKDLLEQNDLDYQSEFSDFTLLRIKPRQEENPEEVQ